MLKIDGRQSTVKPHVTQRFPWRCSRWLDTPHFIFLSISNSSSCQHVSRCIFSYRNGTPKSSSTYPESTFDNRCRVCALFLSPQRQCLFDITHGARAVVGLDRASKNLVISPSVPSIPRQAVRHGGEHRGERGLAMAPLTALFDRQVSIGYVTLSYPNA